MTQDAERRFRAPEGMRAILAQRGVTPGREVLVDCPAAIRAAHTAFVLDGPPPVGGTAA